MKWWLEKYIQIHQAKYVFEEGTFCLYFFLLLYHSYSGDNYFKWWQKRLIRKKHIFCGWCCFPCNEEGFVKVTSQPRSECHPDCPFENGPALISPTNPHRAWASPLTLSTVSFDIFLWLRSMHAFPGGYRLLFSESELIFFECLDLKLFKKIELLKLEEKTNCIL